MADATVIVTQGKAVAVPFGAELLASFIAAATAGAGAAGDAATLAGHYANDNGNADVPGGPAGSRGARYWSEKTAAMLPGITAELGQHDTELGQHAAELGNHETRIGASETELGQHQVTIQCHTVELTDHETRIAGLTATAYGAGANIAVRGNLPSYDPTQFDSLGSGNVPATADSVFNAYGCGFEVTNFGPAANSANFIVAFPRALRPQQWAAVSVLVRSTDGTSWPPANSSAFRALLFDTAGATTNALLGSRYEAIDATHRRYYLAVQNTGATDWVKAYICVYGQGCAFSGFAAAIDDREIADVNWEAFDQLASVYPAGDNICPAGNLPTADTTLFQGLGSGALQPSTDALFNGFGCACEVAGFTSASNTANFIVAMPRRVRPGQWAVSSVLVRSPDGTSWPAANSAFLRTIYTDTNNGQTAVALGNTYTQLDATHRRYHVAVQNTGVFDWYKALICCWGVGMAFTGFAAAIDDRRLSDVNWEMWDPFETAAQDRRLTSLESRLAPVEAATIVPQATPDLLVQSSYHLVQGRPLRLLRDGLTSYRELIGYEIAALNVNGIHVTEAFASPVMVLDGGDFFGNGYFRAKKKGQDTTTFFQTPTRFYTSPATKTGSINYHQIGDSLTERGTTKAVYDRLAAAGLTVTMQGTLMDASNDPVGGLGEGRPNWQATNFTFARTNTETGTGATYGFYEVYPLRPNGGSGLTIATTIVGGAVTAATVSGGTGYPPGTWHVVFGDPANDNGMSGARARGLVTINGSGVPTGVTVLAGGAGYTAAPSGQIVPSYAEYLALGNSGGYGPRWHYNPYLRPASSAEIAASDARIQNGYVFDFVFYVANLLGGTVPDQVTVMLGMNDLLKGGTPLATFLAIGQIVTAVRAGAPNAAIAIAIVGQASTAVWASFVTLTKLLMAQYKGQEANRLFILPLFQVIDDKFVYDSEHDAGIVSATDPQTGMQTVAIADPTHFDDIGRAQAADMISGWVMCRV